jgi:hypothetical protein
MAAVPPLEPGDHLTRDEFERRYNAMPPSVKAELLEGVVFMSPPAVGWNFHAAPDMDLISWLGYYRAKTPGVRGGSNASLRLDLDNEPQPDAALLVEPTYGGQARFSDDHFVVGAPELVAEISGTTVSFDMNLKFHVYRRNGVREYIVWRVRDQAIDWFALKQGQYEKLPADSEGIIRSDVFPGLWLHVPAMLAGDMAQVLGVLEQGVLTKEHADFAAALRARGGAKP